MLAYCVVTGGVTKPDDDPLGICAPTDIATWWFGNLIKSVELSLWNVLTGSSPPVSYCRLDRGGVGTQAMLVREGVGMFASNRSRKVFVFANPELDIGP
nr:hypothetical protein [Nostoc sp. NZL]